MPEEQLPPSRRVPAARTRITCACPRCGDLQLSPPELRLVVCVPEPERSCYQFTCPRCRALVTRQASDRVVLGLCARGVAVDTVPLEALERHEGPALTLDDLLDLSLALQSADVVAAARAEAAG